MNRIRVFVALCFSIGVTRRIAEEVARQRTRMAEAGLRVAWVPAANLHLTLRFLGSIPEDSVEAIAAAIRRTVAAHAPFEARARGLGAFPDAQRPRVLWVGVDGGDPLARLQRDVDAALDGLGFAAPAPPAAEVRAFHPHVTIGRVQAGGSTDAAPSWASEVDLGASLMSEIVVYESKTLRAGAEYLARARVPIGKST